MDYTQEMQNLVRTWFEKRALSYRSAAKIADVNHMTVHKLVNEDVPFSVRPELLKKFSINSGLDLGFNLTRENNLPAYTAIKEVGKGLSLRDKDHPLNEYALNSDFSIDIDKGWAETSALVKLNDQSLEGFRDNLALVHLMPPTHYGVNGSAMFCDMFSSEKSYHFVSLNGVQSVKLLSVDSDNKVFLHVTNDKWAEKNNYKNNRRLVRSDENLVVYGNVIASILIVEKTLSEKVKEINENVDIAKADHVICLVVAAYLGAIAGLDVANILRTIV